MNISATLNVFNLLRNPRLCLPHATVPTFERVPISISTALTVANGGRRPDIRAVVLDKDNCFAKPKENSIYGPYKVRLIRLFRYPQLPFPVPLFLGSSSGSQTPLQRYSETTISEIYRNTLSLFAKCFPALVY